MTADSYPQSVRNRLLSKVPDRTPGQCWEWTAGKFSSGYGALSVEGVNKPAHRVLYVLENGPLDKALHLDHLCRNRGCVNPEHLEPVTPRVNVLRGVGVTAVSARNNVCQAGEHSLDDAYVREDGRRQCRPCQQEKGRARYARRKARQA